MTTVITPKPDRAKTDGLGVWVRGWDLFASFVLLAVAFALVRLDAVKQLLDLAANKAHFAKTPLLLDAHRHGYSHDAVRDHLHALGDAGRAFYAHSFLPIYDLALSVLLLTFSILFILYATQKDKYYAISLPGWMRRVLVVPPSCQFLFDVGENLSLRRLMEEFPRLSQKLVESAALLTQLKWAMIYVNALILIGLAVFTIYRWCTPQSPVA